MYTSLPSVGTYEFTPSVLCSSCSLIISLLYSFLIGHHLTFCLLFFFGHCIVCPLYWFLVFFWYIQTCLCFVDHCLYFCPFPFGHIMFRPSIFGFWLPHRPKINYLLICVWLCIVVSNEYCVVFFFVFFLFVLCTLCCQFLWTLNLWLPLQYSLTFEREQYKHSRLNQKKI